MSAAPIATMSFTIEKPNPLAMALLFDIHVVDACALFEPHLVRGME